MPALSAIASRNGDSEVIAEPTVDTARVSLYVRIARVLRGQIQAGVWPVGGDLPSIPELCSQFRASRNTVRQALDLLRRSGTVTSTRGSRTKVCGLGAQATTDQRVVRAINDPLAEPLSIGIDMVMREDVEQPPPEFCDGSPLYGAYRRFKKVHRIEDQAFVLADFYVAMPVAATFPPGAEGRFKLDRLLLEQRAVLIASRRQIITASHADTEMAAYLGCEMGESAVTVRRWWRGPQDRLVCVSSSRYLASFFIFEVAERNPYRSVAKVAYHGAPVVPPSQANKKERKR
jgi:GntR family transcriptional regulator